MAIVPIVYLFSGISPLVRVLLTWQPKQRAARTASQSSPCRRKSRRSVVRMLTVSLLLCYLHSASHAVLFF
jgi:hypothetical protein